jgi:AraC-like DNA-binding protein
VILSGGIAFRKGHRESLHVHADQGQLKWPSDGVASVRTEQGIFVAGPSHAVWIPAGHEHGGVYADDVFEQNVFVLAEVCQALPKRCCLVRVGSTLAQVIATTVAEDSAYGRRSRASDRALLRLLERSIVDARRRPLDLRLPERSRLHAIVDTLWAHPEDRRTAAAWANELGTAERTLLRLFRKETGSSFRQWRKRARMHRALQMLLAGSEVGQTASQLGYESTSAFVFAFRETLGITPARYFDANRSRARVG